VTAAAADPSALLVEPKQDIESLHLTLVTTSGLAEQPLWNEDPMLGRPRSSSIAMEHADAWSAALSGPLEFLIAATRAAFCTEIKAYVYRPKSKAANSIGNNKGAIKANSTSALPFLLPQKRRLAVQPIPEYDLIWLLW